MAAAALIAAQAADAITYLYIPHEANPIVADMATIPALAAKVALVLLVIATGWLLAHKARKYRGPLIRDALYQLAALAGAFGAGSNVSAILGG